MVESVTNEGVPIVRVYNTEVDLSNQKKYVAFQGASSNVFYQIKATSWSNSGAVFSIQTASPRTGVSRHMYMNYKVQITIATPSLTVPINTIVSLVDTLGLRAFPLHKASSVVSIDLNNARFSLNSRQLINALNLVNLNDMTRRKLGGIAYPDQDVTFNEVNSNRDPYAEYKENVLEETRNTMNYLEKFEFFNLAGASQGSRKVYPSTPPGTVFNPPPANTYSIVFTYNVYEPVLLPPFLLSPDDSAPALVGLQNININFTISDTRMMFGGRVVIADTNGPVVNPVTTVSVVSDSCYVYVQQFTFSPIYPLPNTHHYSIVDIQRYVTQMAPQTGIASVTGGFKTVSSNTFTWNQHPKLILIYGRLPDSEEILSINSIYTLGRTSTFMVINNISVNYANKSGLLSTASQYNLYQMSARYTSQTFSQFNGHQGSLIVLTPQDLSIADDEASGCQGSYIFQMTASCARPDQFPIDKTVDDAIPWELVVVPIMEGVLTTDLTGIVKTSFGVLNPAKILTAPIEFGQYQNYTGVLSGGGWLDTMKGLVGKALGWVSQYAPVVGNVARAVTAPLASLPLASTIANAVGSIAPAVGEVAGNVKKTLGLGGKYIRSTSLRRHLKRK